MNVKSVTKYTSINMWCLFSKLFKIGHDIYISSSFRDGGSTIDRCECFDSSGNYLGKMNMDYFWSLKKGYIEESKQQ